MTFSYSVDLELADRVISSLAAAEAQLSEVVVDLRWRMARLHETWAGTAAAAHLDAHERWCSSYAEMHAALVVMRSVVRTASANYSSAATANASMWGELQ